MYEWQIVMFAGVAIGWIARSVLARLQKRNAERTVYRGRWPVVIGASFALGASACATVHPLFIVLRVAGTAAATGHAINQGRKAMDKALAEAKLKEERRVK